MSEQKIKTFSVSHRLAMSVAKKGKPIPHLHNDIVYKKISISLSNKRQPWIQKEKHPNWKGDNASYFAIHAWLLREYGKANKCENLSCKYPRKNANGSLLLKPKRFEWALIHGCHYQHNRNNYMMLCASCHRKYDEKN